MPEAILDAVKAGNVTHWTAVRILGPLARANEQHSKWLLEYLEKNQASTRQINRFFEHYTKNSKTIRENMCRDPELFFNSLLQ